MATTAKIRLYNDTPKTQTPLKPATPIRLYTAPAPVPKPPTNKFGLDVSSHPFNPLNPNNQISEPFPTVNPLKEAFKPSSLVKATGKIGNYLYNHVAQIVAPGITPEEARDPKILKDTLVGLPKAAWKVTQQAVAHPVKTATTAISSSIRGLSDVITTAVINVLPQKATGVERQYLLEAVADLLDRSFPTEHLANNPTQQAIGEGFRAGGSAAPFIAAGGVGGELFGGAGTVAGFLGAGQTQVSLNATVKERANQMMNDLVGLGLFTAGSVLFKSVKAKATTAIKESLTKPPPPTESFPKANPLVEAKAEFTTKPVPEAPITPKTAPETTITPKSDPLTQEATKYKSAEEFVKALESDKGGIGKGVEYAPARRLAETHRNDTPLTNFGFKPEEKVTIYRGVDNAIQKEIVGGDYIATSPELAGTYTGGKVISKKVPASSVRFSSGDGIKTQDFKNGFNKTHLEAIYNPEPPLTKSQLTDIWNKANKPVETKPVVKTEVPKAPDEFQSRVFERLKAEHPEALKGELTYDPIKLEAEAKKDIELIVKDKQKAYDIAMGKEKSGEHTQTGVNIALAEKALQDGNNKLYAELITNRSLANTRRGQEIVSEKGSVTDNSTSRYVKELIASKLDKLGKDFLSDLKDTFKKKSTKEKAMAKIDSEVVKLEKKIKTKKLDTKTALDLLDKLTCLT